MRPTRPTARRLACCAAPLLLAAAGQAHAQSIFVEQYTAGAWRALPGFDAPGGGSGLPSGSDIALELAGSAVVRISTDDPASTDIGLVSVRVLGTGTPTVLIASGGGPGVNEASPIGAPGARSIAGVIAPDAAMQIHAGSVSGPGIEARHLVRLDLSGDLDGRVIHWGQPGSTQPGIGGIDIGGSVTANAGIVAVHGRVDRVDVHGDLLGDLAAQNGGFGPISIEGNIGNADRGPSVYAWSGAEALAIETLVVGGAIGTPGTPARVITGGPVFRIEADEIHADIDTQLTDSDFGFVGGVIARAGDLTGSLVIRSLSGFAGNADAPCVISAAGDLDGIIIVENVVRNENPSGPEIDIGGSVTAGSVISVNGMVNLQPGLPGSQIRVGTAGGLQGQIIVHDRDVAPFDADDSIVVGSGFAVSPQTTSYLTLFEELGGGSVGIAPFNFHPIECFPQHNETITIAPGSALTGAVIRLYGPAFGEAPAFVIEHRADPISSWTDRSGDFTVLAADTEGASTREIRVEAIGTAAFDAGEWRLRPVDNTLRCAFTVGLPSIGFDSEYADDTYRFTVVSDCPGGGRTTTNDLRGQDEGDYVNPVDPGVDPCP